MKPSIITLLTDFGSQDYFVGAMKGVILSINPAAQIVDLTHEIPPQDIHAAAFNLLASYRSFPPQTIHVAVVDPGVGSARRPLLIESGEQFFVGPDNGIFSWICERGENCRARHLTNQEFFRHPVSATFHGRDVFAPVAAALSNGLSPEKFGPSVADLVRLESLEPKVAEEFTEASIIHIDRFGNCITNLTRDNIGEEPGLVKLVINRREVTAFRKFFAEHSEGDHELFCLIGSAGFLEIAARNASAAEVLDARPGQKVTLFAGVAR